MIIAIATFVGGVAAGYFGYRVGFKMGVLAAMARMNAVIVQMQDVVQDIEQFQKQWTEDDL
jgi:threonine synthase